MNCVFLILHAVKRTQHDGAKNKIRLFFFFFIMCLLLFVRMENDNNNNQTKIEENA